MVSALLAYDVCTHIAQSVCVCTRVCMIMQVLYVCVCVHVSSMSERVCVHLCMGAYLQTPTVKFVNEAVHMPLSVQCAFLPVYIHVHNL